MNPPPNYFDSLQLLSYEPRWLHLGLETIFDETIPVGGSEGSAASRHHRTLRVFVAQVLNVLYVFILPLLWLIINLSQDDGQATLKHVLKPLFEYGWTKHEVARHLTSCMSCSTS